MAACGDVTVNKLAIDPMRGCEFSTQFVCQPAEGYRPRAGKFHEFHAVYWHEH